MEKSVLSTLFDKMKDVGVMAKSVQPSSGNTTKKKANKVSVKKDSPSVKATSKPKEKETPVSVKSTTQTKKPFSKPLPYLLQQKGIQIQQFKFGLADTDELIYRKVRYIKDLIKGKEFNVKRAILEYYNIHVDLEKRSNQLYYYGWINLNNCKYKFYVGKNK